MKLSAKLFHKGITATDLRTQLPQIAQDQGKRQRDLDALEQTKQANVQ
jgi:hypothetical protein